MGWLGDALRHAIEAEATMAHGMEHGLTKAEAEEVLGAFIERNLAQGRSWNREEVRRAMDARADAQPWDPRTRG